MINDLKFIIVDDDLFSNMLSKRIIKKATGVTDVTAFNIPEDGIAYIQNEPRDSFGYTVMLLDINMPTLTGWEFLELFELFGNEIQPPITIYMFSSSINQDDKDRASSNKFVKGFISKPLSIETIVALAASKQ